MTKQSEHENASGQSLMSKNYSLHLYCQQATHFSILILLRKIILCSQIMIGCDSDISIHQEMDGSPPTYHTLLGKLHAAQTNYGIN